jgi:hypothetical protein
VTYLWKALDEGYNFDLGFISIRGMHAKLWGPKVVRSQLGFISIGGMHIKLWGSKVVRVPSLTILGLPLGNLGTKCHLDVGLVERHIVYYKGKGFGFPQVQAVVSLVSPSLPMAHPNTKSVPIMH